MALTSLFSRPWSARARLRPRHLRLVALPLAISRGIILKPRSKLKSPKLLDKVKVAENEWKKQAEEIKAGTRKHILDELEERGFVKNFIG